MMQIQSDVLDCEVNRPKIVETTALGCAYCTGLAVGFWKDLDEIAENREVSKIYYPKMDAATRDELYSGWKKAIERAKDWIDH